jgi:hypothetical protein
MKNIFFMLENKTIRRNRRPKTFSTMFSSSVRLNLTYIVLFVWIGLAVFAIIVKSDLYALAVYFTSGLPVIIGYLWVETSRPSMKDAAEMVKSINMRGNQTQTQTDQYQTYGQPYSGTQTVTQQSSISFVNDIDNQDEISIYADDATAELKINNEQLSTLMNTGYVDKINDKYTFKKSMIDQIKSLIDSNNQDPDI